MEREGVSSSKAVRGAIMFYEYCLREKEKGNKVVMKRRNGKVVDLEFVYE